MWTLQPLTGSIRLSRDIHWDTCNERWRRGGGEAEGACACVSVCILEQGGKRCCVLSHMFTPSRQEGHGLAGSDLCYITLTQTQTQTHTCARSTDSSAYSTATRDNNARYNKANCETETTKKLSVLIPSLWHQKHLFWITPQERSHIYGD